MKKLIAVLVAATLMLSGITAFAAGTPADEAAIYRALMTAGFSNPDYMTRHFDSIAALTATQLSAMSTYFSAIDSALGVAVTNVDLNMASSQKVTVIANLNAIMKILQLSYKVFLQMPTSVKYYPIDADGKVLDEADDTADNVAGYKLVPTGAVAVELTTDQIITGSFTAAFSGGIDSMYAASIGVDDSEDVALDVYGNPVLVKVADANQPYAVETEDYDLLPWTVDTEDLYFSIVVYCAEKSGCLSTLGGALSDLTLQLSVFEVTGRDSMFASKSGLRNLFSNIQNVVTAVANYKPAAALPSASPTASSGGDRLPDTATSYGNTALIGVALMLLAAAAAAVIARRKSLIKE